MEMTMEKKTQVLNIYGVDIPVTITSTIEGDTLYDSGRELIITGTFDKSLYPAVLAAAEAIIAAETDCSGGEEPCWCWSCRQGAGSGKACDQFISYGTGSGHGKYAIFADGNFEVIGSPRSLESGGEYAALI